MKSDFLAFVMKYELVIRNDINGFGYKEGCLFKYLIKTWLLTLLTKS